MNFPCTLKNDLLTTELEPVHESASHLVSDLGRVRSGRVTGHLLDPDPSQYL